MAKARGARLPRGQSPPPLASPVAGGGMSSMALVAFGCGRLHPWGGECRRSTARLLRAAEMRPKTSGSKAGGSVAGGGGGVAVLGGSPVAPVVTLAGQPLDGRSQAPDRSRLWRLFGGRTGRLAPLPVGWVPHSLPSPDEPGGQVWGISGVWSPRAPWPRGGVRPASWGHEATETGFAYAPVSQAHGNNHIVQCHVCCTAA